MIRAFIDASVLFSACYSATGASRAIISHALHEEVILVISDVVIEEVARNLAMKRPAARILFDQLCQLVPFEIVEATREEVEGARAYVALKDAPIIAAAKKAEVDFLVSLDRRHLVEIPEVAHRSGLTIVPPEKLLEKIRKSGTKR